jgi:hypothetical protein
MILTEFDKKPVPVPVCRTLNPHGLTRARTWGLRSERPAANSLSHSTALEAMQAVTFFSGRDMFLSLRPTKVATSLRDTKKEREIY